ncbi:MAG: D-mannonate epimerase, partial [Bacteroidales bacterium]|nr:D-mannonate epimerase [Bacteroidales bacterium]
MLYCSKTGTLGPGQVREALGEVFAALGTRNRVLAIPPDFTRLNSFAGPITGMVQDYYGDALTDVLPALGTHSAMTPEQIAGMFPG